MKNCILTLFALLLATSAMAQGSGTIGGGTSSGMDVTRNLQGTLVEIDLEENVVLLKTDDDKVYRFEVVKRTRLRADKRSTLASRKNIELTDFVEGHTVKITFKATEPQRAVELRLLPAEAGATS